MADETKRAGLRVRVVKRAETKAVRGRARKQVTPGLIASAARPLEDDFAMFLEVRKGGMGEVSVLPTPFDVRDLERVTQQSSMLPSLIEAMETNVDGTGWDIVPVLLKDINTELPAAEAGRQEISATARLAREKERQELEAFFNEPYPGHSFLTMRRRLRRDLEVTGNGYFEILRNALNEVTFIRYLESRGVRMVKLDAEVPVDLKIERGGKKIEVRLAKRERRFVQVIGGSLIYFKELGASRDLNKGTGEWAPPGVRLPQEIRATELLHFTLKQDIATPYGVPRWVSNAPSAVGARKAEEYNLEFFDAGGIPPLLIIVQGGQLAEEAEQELRQHFSAQGPSRHQAAILEAFSTEGDIDSPSQVRVKVERFGSDRVSDSMFEKYLKNCDQRLQRAFRLPALFVGQEQSLTFATAFASYVVAEAQIFACERKEFDSAINLRLMPLLPGGKNFIYKSKSLTVVDITQKLVALDLVKDVTEASSLLRAVNEITQLNLEQATSPLGEEDDEEEPEDDGEDGRSDRQRLRDRDSVPPDTRPARVPKSELRGLQTLAQDLGRTLMRSHGAHRIAHLRQALKQIRTLSPLDVTVFKAALAREVFPEYAHDPAGAAELAWTTLHVSANEADAAWPLPVPS